MVIYSFSLLNSVTNISLNTENTTSPVRCGVIYHHRKPWEEEGRVNQVTICKRLCIADKDPTARVGFKIDTCYILSKYNLIYSGKAGRQIGERTSFSLHSFLYNIPVLRCPRPLTLCVCSLGQLCSASFPQDICWYIACCCG